MKSLGHLLKAKATLGPLVPVSASRDCPVVTEWLRCIASFPTSSLPHPTLVALDIRIFIYIFLILGRTKII